jgi:hypothetical protein
VKHLSGEDLIALYYGESSLGSDAARHLRSCRECAASYAQLKEDLETIKRIPVPQRSAQYGEQVWQALHPSLPAYERKHQSWHLRIQWQALSWGAACAMLIAVAFLGGRYWERHTIKAPATVVTATPQSAQRIVLVVLTDHLDRTERLLVALQHTDPSDTIENSQLQTEARDLLASNRLYRAGATKAGDPALAAALDQLERVLVEIANDPSLSEADLNRLRQEMNTEGILFEIRVLLSRTPDQTKQAEDAKGASI